MHCLDVATFAVGAKAAVEERRDARIKVDSFVMFLNDLIDLVGCLFCLLLLSLL